MMGPSLLLEAAACRAVHCWEELLLRCHRRKRGGRGFYGGGGQ